MTVHLRKRKQRKNGKISLYLEIYKGKIILPNGKPKFIREYRFLNIYLVDNPKTEIDKKANKEKLQIANAIKSKTEVEINKGNSGILLNNKCKNTNFCEYFYGFVEQKQGTSSYIALKGVYKDFIKFAGENITFEELTEGFCTRFLDYLHNKKSQLHKNLSASSIQSYWRVLGGVIRQAIREKIITDNPLLQIKIKKPSKPKIIYLTFDELKLLVDADCKKSELKRAFIFSCLTGLRWSDVYKLKWGEILQNQDKYSIEYRQKKTSELNYLPLSEQALLHLGERGKDADLVFNLQKYDHRITTYLQDWCRNAGINKKVKYHSSRHTFAVLLLSYGTPIFTLQKLMGHTNISSTMVYADIVDSEKEKAMNVIPSIL